MADEGGGAVGIDRTIDDGIFGKAALNKGLYRFKGLWASSILKSLGSQLALYTTRAECRLQGKLVRHLGGAAGIGGEYTADRAGTKALDHLPRKVPCRGQRSPHFGRALSIANIL